MNCLDWIFWLLKSNPKLENTIFALFRNKWLAHYNLPQTNFLSHEPYIATKQPLKTYLIQIDILCLCLIKPKIQPYFQFQSLGDLGKRYDQYRPLDADEISIYW